MKTLDGSLVMWDLNQSKASLSVTLPRKAAVAACFRENENRNTRNTVWIAGKVWKLKLAEKISILENVKHQRMIPL